MIGSIVLLMVGAIVSAEESPAPKPKFSFFRSDDSAITSTEGNRVGIVSGGYDALLLRVHLIREAKHSIVVQTFIWTNDESGRLLMYELIEAAKRGVKVRIIADHMVSERNPETAAFLAQVHPSLQVKHYRPAMARLKGSFYHTILAGIQSFRDVNQRMHNKVMVFDDRVLITGGRNIENTYYDHSTTMNFRDRDVVAIGPVAKQAMESFEQFWNYRQSVASRDLKDVAAAIESGQFPHFEKREDYDFGGYFEEIDRDASDHALIESRFAATLRPVKRVAFVSDEPGKSNGYFSKTARITRELRKTLEQAKHSIVMQTPYLVLSKPATKLIEAMHEKNPGLRIRISSNSFASTDNLLAYSANYRLRNQYVSELKLEIHEFKPLPATLPELFPTYRSMLTRARERMAEGKQDRLPFMCIHAKSLVVDDRVAFVGSYNLDPRSEALNTEVGLLIEDEVFARELRLEIERDMRADNSWAIARRSIPLGLDTVNSLIGTVMGIGPIDLWPVQNTSSFELKPGGREVPLHDPAFYENYREAGAFPGSDGTLSQKEILTRIYKAVGSPLTPIL